MQFGTEDIWRGGGDLAVCIGINEDTKQSKKYTQQRGDIADNVIDFSANFTDMRSGITHILCKGGRH